MAELTRGAFLPPPIQNKVRQDPVQNRVKTIEEIWAPHQCEFVNGFPEDLMSHLEETNDRGSL